MRNILFLLFVSISISAFGQKHFVGVQAGLNLTNITAKDGRNENRFYRWN
jgi:hypothetical protein